MVARITNDGLWRVSYGDDTRLDIEQLVKNQPKKYRQILPGHPEPGDYNLVNVSPYRIHQRCAEKFRVGRILLAADAAHLVNPFGGLGLTGGLVDVGGLAECFIGIATSKAGDEILDKYDEVRRQVWHDLLNPGSSSNFLRVSATDPETALEKDEFLALLAALELASGDSVQRKEFDEVCPYTLRNIRVLNLKYRLCMISVMISLSIIMKRPAGRRISSNWHTLLNPLIGNEDFYTHTETLDSRYAISLTGNLNILREKLSYYL